MFIEDKMPLIRIDIPEGVSTDIKKQVHIKVRKVISKTLAHKEVYMTMFLLEKLLVL